jgi:hypothetical protein
MNLDFSTARDNLPGLILLAFGLCIAGFAFYALRWRQDAMSVEELQVFSIVSALMLVLIAAMVTIGSRLMEADGQRSQWYHLVVAATQLKAVYLAFALGAFVFAIAFFVLRSGTLWIGRMSVPSLDSIRDYAFCAATILLVTAVIYSAANYMLQGTFSHEFTSIAPFTIAGSDDKQRGFALATALQAKLSELDRDAEMLDRIAQHEERGRDAESEIVVSDRVESSPLNVFHQIDLELKFQGVDVGGIFSRVVDSFAMRRALQITVAEQGEKAVVSGALRPDGKTYVYANVGKENERIVAAVAYSKLRERLITRQAGYQNLEWEDIEALHQTLLAVTHLRASSQVKMDQYKPHHVAIARLIDKAPSLERLLLLGAEIAMKAGEVDSALAFLDRASFSLSDLRERLDRARPDKKADQQEEDEDSDTEFRELRHQFVGRFNNQVLQRQRALSNCALTFVEKLNKGEEPGPVFKDALVRHRELLRIADANYIYQPAIAIIGGTPQRDRVHYAFETRGESPIGRPAYDNYADTLGSIIVALAPHAKLIFVPLGTASRTRGSILSPNEQEIADAAEIAVEAKADIIVIPFAFTRSRERTVKLLSRRALVITFAPSQTWQERFKINIKDADAAYVVNVDVDGRFKLSTLSSDEVPSRFPGALGAPGTRIPRLEADGQWRATYGTGYAASTAAAVFANLLGVVGKIDSKHLIELARRTARQTDPRDSTTEVIDQMAAMSASEIPTQTIAGSDTACGR